MLCWFLFAGFGRVVGSHISFHTSIDDPDPTVLINPLITRDLADTILCQSYDGKYDLIGSQGDTFLKYRPLKTRENKVLGFSITPQNFFYVGIVFAMISNA